jgi:hypothetical protein
MEELVKDYRDALESMMNVHKETLAVTVVAYQDELKKLLGEHQNTLKTIVEKSQEQIDSMKIGSTPTEQQLNILKQREI